MVEQEGNLHNQHSRRTLTALVFVQWQIGTGGTPTDPDDPAETPVEETATEPDGAATADTPSAASDVSSTPPSERAPADAPPQSAESVMPEIIGSLPPLREKLLATDRLVLGYLRENIEAGDTARHVAIRDIVAACGMCRKTAQVAVQRLAALELVEQIRQPVGAQVGCRYRLLRHTTRDNLVHLTTRKRS